MPAVRPIAAATLVALVCSCATQPTGTPQEVAAARMLRSARSPQVALEERAGDYLEAAALTAPERGSGVDSSTSTDIYNSAAAELTILLRSAEGGRLWNHPLTLTGGNETYHLRLRRGDRGTWAPDRFTSFQDAKAIKGNLIRE